VSSGGVLGYDPPLPRGLEHRAGDY